MAGLDENMLVYGFFSQSLLMDLLRGGLKAQEGYDKVTLSPMLFLIMVEGIMKHILKAQSLGLLDGFKVVEDCDRV